MGIDTSKKRARIAIFSTDDPVWGLFAWRETIPLLLNGHEIAGLHLFPNHQKEQKPLWYLRVFGPWSFFILGLFKLKRHLHSKGLTWERLAAQHELPLFRWSSPNEDNLVQWSKQNNIDIIIIMVSHLLKAPILNTARIGVINKHAGLLPGCKGVFPYFWSKLEDIPTGVSFHEVDTGVDTGRLLLQLKYPLNGEDPSMLRFYMDVFSMYPKLLNQAIGQLMEDKSMAPLQELKPSYHSFPKRDDVRRFLKKGGRIGRFSDLFYHPSKAVREVMHEVCGH